ncbi:restriction endonuclease subunit S [Paenibacillus sp. S29]|uniref:restriction endonuclease subunit S n=1 Tax=Paenibacillus sp. S29 TaxID=3394611 RepID=UPI0039BEE921
MTEQEKLVPKRRFKEFGNATAWEQREYGEVIDLLSGQDFSPSEYNDTFNGIPYMTGASCIVGTETIVNRWTTVPRCLAEKGDVLLVCKGSGYGAIAVLAQDKAHIARQFMALKNLPNLDKVFNFYLLNSVIENIKKDARGLIAGIARDAVIKQEISIPLFEEQSQIGTFFKQLDHLITLHQRKLEKLKSLKSAYLSEMFPAEGENMPKRRFAGFTGAWEQRKLGELADIVRGASPRPIQDPKWFDDKSETGWLRISDVTEQNGRIHHLEQRISKAGQEKTRVLEEPHLLLSIAATVGKPVVNYIKTGVHDGFLIFQDPKFDREFMFQWLEAFRPQWRQYGQPGSQVNLNSDIVKNQEIALPNEEEQKEIGVFFSKLDHLITLHQRKLEKLQNIKRAYLNEMFV